jgi:hypothetical protein
MLRTLARSLVVLAVIAAAGGAAAGGYRASKSGYEGARAAPVKDCTRFNGRWGYYGNPWCTAQEQARWDRWSAGRR